MSQPTAGERAIALLRKLLEQGQWYISAIELSHQADGEDLREEAEAILRDADEEKA